MGLRRYRVWIWLISLLLVACVSPTARFVRPPTITPESFRSSLPGFLNMVSPAPDEVISLREYNRVGSDVRFSVREAPGVCIEVDATVLLTDGDHWNASDVVSRTTIWVDGERRENVGLIDDYAISNTISFMDAMGVVVGQASVGGPYAWCVASPLDRLGEHSVNVTFVRSTDEVEEYNWSFELME